MVAEYLHIKVRAEYEQALRDAQEAEAAAKRLAAELETARIHIKILEEEIRILRYGSAY